MSTKTIISAVSSVSAPTLDSLPSVSAEDIAALEGALDAFSLTLATGFKMPSPEDLARLARPSRNVQTFVTTTANLAKRYAVQSPSNPVDQMLANQTLVETLAPVIERVGAVAKLLIDVSRVATSDSYRSATVLYSQLRAEGRSNPALRNALIPLVKSKRQTYTTPEGTKTRVAARKAPKPPKPTTQAKGAAATDPTAAAAPTHALVVAAVPVGTAGGGAPAVVAAPPTTAG